MIFSIDTGVMFEHETLINSYDGNNNGKINHNYKWFDPKEFSKDVYIIVET